MLTAAAAVHGEACRGGAAAEAGTCASWCRAEKCRFCKCSGCSFCAAAGPPAVPLAGASMLSGVPGSSGGGGLRRTHQRYAQYKPGPAGCSPRDGSVPFVMWMPGRTGSTWVQEALNSHPEVTMLGEVFNNGSTGEEFSRNMCSFYGAPIGRRVRRVRGFKQKFFQCNADLHDKLCDFRRHPMAMRALESCLRPAGMPPPAGMAPDAGWNVSTRSYSVYSATGARVICSLRRSSLDRALSKGVQLALFRKCGVSNAVTETERACLHALQQEGVTVDVDKVLQLVQEAEMAAEYNAAVCEAQARFSPVFFLWYEDLLAQPEAIFDELQRFLGVEPRRLKSTAQRIVSTGAASWIANLKQVQDAATRMRGDRGQPATGASCG